jgi:hypothetical protein
VSVTSRKLKKLKELHKLQEKLEQSLTSEFKIPANYSVVNNASNKKHTLILHHKTEEEAEEYLRSRGYDNIKLLYHGTSLHSFESIANVGFKVPTFGGTFGKGVYFGNKDKAECFIRTEVGVLLLCMVALGRVWWKQGIIGSCPDNYDSTHALSSRSLRREEWCVKDTKRIVILRVYIRFNKPALPWRKNVPISLDTFRTPSLQVQGVIDTMLNKPKVNHHGNPVTTLSSKDKKTIDALQKKLQQLKGNGE